MWKLAVVPTIAALALAITAAAALGTRMDTFGVKAVLDAAQVVPRQAISAPAARGVLSGSLTTSPSATKLIWSLTYQRLSGRALHAEVQIGRVGRIGPVAFALCGPCRSGAYGVTRLTAKQAHAIETGRAYVNLRTRRNPKGEIRGQIRLVQGQ